MKGKGANSPLAPVIGCLCVQLCVGILYIWSVLKMSVVEHYGWTAEAANMVSSYMLFAFVLGNLIGGFLQDKTNPKLIATIGSIMFCLGVFLTSLLTSETIGLINLTYCVLSGLGTGFAYGSVLSCIQKWFPHRRGFASGLSVSAFGLSTVVFSPLFKWMLGLESFGDQAVPLTFRTMSIVFFIATMLACLLIRLPSTEYIQKLNLPAAKAAELGNSKTPGQAMKMSAFWLIACASFFLNGAWNVAVPIIKDLGMLRGLSENWAVITVSLTGITNAVGRLGMAAVSDKIGRSTTISLLGVITCVSSVVLIFMGGPVYVIFILMLALAYGGGAGTLPALTTDLFGPKYSGTNYGIMLMSLGLSSVVFNGLSTYFIESTGGYVVTFVIAAIVGILPVFFMMPLRRRLKRDRAAAQKNQA